MAPSHYQLSFTARQAMLFFGVCLAALGLSFFFGLMTGLSGRAADARPAPAAASAATPAPSSEADNAVAGAPPEATAGPAESPTPPTVLQAFEDRVSEPTVLPSPTKRAVSAEAPRPPAAGMWIQVASLASRREADALTARLSGKGYHAQIVAADGPKGKVFRVRVGPYRSDEEAARAADKLRRQEHIRDTWVVRDGR